MYRVMIVDDYKPFWQFASDILGQAKEFEVVAVAATGEEALRLADEVCPDLVLMDVELGSGISGLEATKRILKRYCNTKVVLVSMHYENEYSRLATQVGALAFIAKRDLSLETLMQALGVAKGVNEGLKNPGP